MKPRVFVLDSNVFIQAKRHYYAFDLVPNFWGGWFGMRMREES